MGDRHKTREELINELSGLKRRVAELEEEVQRHRQEDSLRPDEARYRALFDGVPVGLFRTTPAGQIVDANLAMMHIAGYPSRQDLLTTNVIDLYVDPQDRVRLREAVERDGILRDFETQLRQHDGQSTWVSLTLRAVRDERGQVLHYEGSLEDISARKQAEEELYQYQEHLEELVEARTVELRESEARYRTLFDGVPVGLYRATPAGKLLDVNLAAVQMLGYPSREEALAVVNTADLYVDPEERVRWQTLMAEQGVVRDFEEQIRRCDGTVIWLSDTARAVRDKEGRVLHYEGIVEDITERKRAALELRHQKEYFEALFVHNPVAMVTAHPDGTVISWNPMAERLFAYAEEEAVGRNLDHLVANHDSIREEAAAYTDQVTSLGRVQATTKRTRKDGSLVDVELLALPVVVTGETVGFSATYHDISDVKRLEEEIRRQKDYFEALFINNPVAVLTADLQGNVVSWNPMAERLFGYTREEAVGKNADLLVANDDSIREEAVEYTDQVLGMQLERLQVATKRTRKDGSLVDVELLGLPITVAGEMVGYIAMYHDITERKELEEEIRRRRDYFEALFVNSPAAVYTVDLDANVVSWNPMAEELFGYTQEEAIGKNVDDLVAADSSISEEAQSYTDQLLTTNRFQATTRRSRKDGSLVDVKALALPVIVADEKVGYIGIYHDITELQQARREAEAANQAKSSFLANMSHELRTPLNAILGFTQLMDGDQNLTVEQKENLGIISRSGEHLLALMNDVLQMSKIEAGQVTLQEKRFDLCALLDGLEEMFRLRAEQKGLELSCERCENVPQYVSADESKLRQVLLNLLGNAVKFTQEGGVICRLTMPSPAVPSSEGMATLHFEVEDTGPGIAPDELETVFYPFVQAALGQQAQEGTGLGLSISRRFVRLMGGDITVGSDLGQGSLFSFDVQVRVEAVRDAELARLTKRALGLEPGQPTYRLLVAEDRETNRRLLVQLLTDLGSPPLGFHVQEAANGQDAIEMFERWEPHLILMDMRMPVMDGYEATRRIKATAKGQATIVVALTASAFEEDRDTILSAGCDDVVRKPFRTDEIYDILARHLGVRFLYEEGETTAAPLSPDAAPPVEILTSAALAALPDGWVADLQQATTKADLDSILALADRVRGQHAALADTLTGLAHDFEYRKILRLIEGAGGSA